MYTKGTCSRMPHKGTCNPHDWAVLCGAKLDVVNNCRHLWTQVAVNLSPVFDASAKASSTISAYAPMAGRVCKAPGISVDTKKKLANSLLWSKIFLNSQVAVHDGKAIQQMDGTYMRMLRAIARLELRTSKVIQLQNA